MKKKIGLIAASVIAASAMAAFVGCGGNGGGYNPNAGIGGGAGTEAEAGAKSAYGIGAVTTVSLLAGGSSTAALRSTVSTASATEAPAAPEQGTTAPDQGTTAPDQGTTTPDQGTTTPDQGGAAGSQDAVKDEVKDFNEYFNMLDTFLDEEAVKTTVTENTNEAYAFDYVLTVEGKNLDGTVITHTMYYSERELGSHTEQDDDEFEHSVKFELTGVMEMNGVAYNMTGYRAVETETEGNEEEVQEELWIRATHPTERGNYVQMTLEQDSETEGSESETEREYVYSIYGGGKLIESASVSFESENEHGATETEYELRVNKGGKVSYYEVERMERVNGVPTIGVKYRLDNGEQGRFVVTKGQDGQYHYAFTDGTGVDFDDFDDDDDHDDDDDDDRDDD